MKFNLIDFENWKRKEYFHHYKNIVPCTYSITVNIDITDFSTTLKKHNIKLFPALIHALTTMVNHHEEFRMGYDKDSRLGYFDAMSPSYTIFNSESEMFSSIWTPYHSDFSVFYEHCIEDIKRYEKAEQLFPQTDIPPNTFPVSSIPWASFKGFNLNVSNDGSFLLPIFTFGKHFKQEQRRLLPLSVQVHHAVCDGFHAGRFIEGLQERINRHHSWLNLK